MITAPEAPGFLQSLEDVWQIWSAVFPRNKYLVVLSKTLRRLNTEKVSHLKRHAVTEPSSLHRMIWKSLPTARFLNVFSEVLFDLGRIMLPIARQQTIMVGLPENQLDAMKLVADMTEALQALGLRATLLDAAAARAGNSICSYWVDAVCVSDLRGDYEKARDSPQVSELVDQVAQIVWPAIRALNAALGIQRLNNGDEFEPTSKLVAQWQECAKLRLASIRANQIFDIFLLQDSQVRLHLLTDLVDILSNPSGRAIVEMGMQASFSKHLLHAGSRTVDVLDAFVLIIQALTEPLTPAGVTVDESGVLLDRSARAIRRFLLHREDAARIVISSLLDPQEVIDGVPPTSTDHFSGRISTAMFGHTNPHTAQKSYEGQNLTDINWRPEPIDALSTHRLNTEKDIIGHMTSIQKDDIFIQELEAVLGKRLLDSDLSSFHNEQRLLAMFRARFDEESGDGAKIQASDVMLFDMQRSLGWLETVKEKLAKSVPDHPALTNNFKAKVLSRSYWTSLENLESTSTEHDVVLPEDIQSFLRAYEIYFKDIAIDREIDWFHDLGKVTIEVDFKDRPSLTIEVTTVQATILNCFQEHLANIGPMGVSVSEIHSTTKLPVGDIRKACKFWVDRGVLHPREGVPETFLVNETGDGLTSAEEAGEFGSRVDQSEPTEKTARQRLEEHAETYLAYIDAMLRNLGAMSTDGILQTLSMFVPGGFAHDENDLAQLLEQWADEGKVERSGSLWAYSGDADGEENEMG